MAVLLETSIGNIAIDLYVDEAPQESLNFLKLCKTKYYNFSPFHRVLKNFIAQTGDPLGTGRGGSSIWEKVKGEDRRFFPRRETNRIKHVRYGTVSMTNNGGDMHGSQFFITLGDNLDSLDGRHSVFGEVAEESYEVLEQLNEAFVDDNGRPYQDVRIRHTIVLDDPFDDPEGLARFIPEKSPEPTAEQLRTVRIADDAALDDNEGMTEEEILQLQKRKLGKAQATILEMVGDIADADAAPAENVLFVCKLNPVTTAEDLEIIFSRFGKVVSCHIVTDWKTKESLQYGFVEFDKTESAEEAYFKMDNVLVDDRRIKVNFCQSIEKSKWNIPKRYAGGGVNNIALKKGRATAGDKYSLVFDDASEADTGPRLSKRNRDGHERSRDRDRGRDRERDHRDRSRDHRDRSRERDRDRRDRDTRDRHGRDRERSRDDRRRDDRRDRKDDRRDRDRSRDDRRDRDRSRDDRGDRDRHRDRDRRN